MSGFRPWEQAWAVALYGPHGFYRRPEGPAGHFRTAAHASRGGLLGAALARLARETGCTAVLDVGAGHGELLSAVAAADPALACRAVEITPRPPALPGSVAWSADPVVEGPTLLVAWELLDVVPAGVLQVDDGGNPRVVEVRADGTERLGGRPAPPDLEWCARWWPLDGAEPGNRVEVGRARDEAWAALVDRLDDAGGLALAVDYAHELGSRPPSGSLLGYRRGRALPPAPDGSMDVTAHVALDAVAAVRPAAVRTSQRAALRALGVPATRPATGRAAGLATADPAAYLRELAKASEAGELCDPAGLGGFGWVLHPVGERAASWSRTAGLG